MNEEAPKRDYIVKILGGRFNKPVKASGVLFDSQADMNLADAVLCVGHANGDLLAVRGPKAWWAMEALSHSIYRKGAGRLLTEALRLNEWFHFAHPDARFVVPVYTHIHNCVLTGNEERLQRAVAVVSNTGGMWWRARPGIRLRNHFIVHKDVDLFGSKQAWQVFRPWGPFFAARRPLNYVGELGSGNMCRETIEKMAEYKVVVCMENTCEPQYFTEKVVQAVQAGAIPVYHAHPTVRDGILSGARWIDPENHGFNVRRTLETALKADLKAFQGQNEAWFRTRAVAATHIDRVWERVATIMRYCIENRPERQPMPSIRDAVSFRRRIVF